LKERGAFKGHSVLASLYVETFKCRTARPILTSEGKVSGAVNNYGKGKAYLIGTFIGHAYAAFKDEPTKNLLLSLLRLEGVQPELCMELPRRRRIYDDKEAWFLVNMTPNHVIRTMGLDGFSKVADLIEGPFETKLGEIKVEIKPFSIRCLVLER